MKNTHIIAHHTDLDGIICHAIAKRWNSEIVGHDIKYGFESEPWEKINEGDVYFCDLGYSTRPSNLKMIEKIKTLKNNGQKIYFFDHHPWPKELIQDLFHIAKHNLKSSSSPLLGNFLLPNDEIVRGLGQLAFRDDHNKGNKMSNTLTDILNSQYDTWELINHLSTIKNIEDCIPENSYDYLREYRESINEAKKNLLSNSKVFNINGIDYVIGFSPKELFLKPGHREIKDKYPNKNTICLFDKHSNVMFRTTDEKTYNFFIKAFNSGGRDLEGGFNFDSNTDNSNFSQRIEKILNTLNNSNYYEFK